MYQQGWNFLLILLHVLQQYWVRWLLPIKTRFCNNTATPYYSHKKQTKADHQHYFKRKPQWVVNEVIRLSALMPNHGCRSIAYTFNRLHEHKKAMTVSKSYVAHHVKQHRHAIQQMRAKIKNKPAKIFAKNTQWAIDLSHLTSDNRQDYLALGFIDCGTRFCLNLEAVKDKTSISLLRVLFKVIEQYGNPRP